MKLQDQVITLSQAKRLKELGVMQGNSPFYFEDWLDKIQYNPGGHNLSQACFSAYTVAELGQMLPSETFTERTGSEGSAYANWQWIDQGRGKASGPYNTEAEARAEFLIHLLETDSITAEEVNKRLDA